MFCISFYRILFIRHKKISIQIRNILHGEGLIINNTLIELEEALWLRAPGKRKAVSSARSLLEICHATGFMRMNYRWQFWTSTPFLKAIVW
jgi:hypothetical protein